MRNDTETPGQTLKTMLRVKGWKQKQLAAASGLSNTYVSELIRDRRRFSTAVALTLEEVLETPASFWVQLQAEYDLKLERQRRGQPAPVGYGALTASPRQPTKLEKP